MLVGLTGGIGCGKTYISNGLRAKGLLVYDCDQRAQILMRENVCVRSQIELIFGSDIYENDQLNRQRVAQQVFSEPQLLQKVNEAVHPAVRFDLQEWAKKNGSQSILFCESAILFESGLNDICDVVVCVVAPLETRIKRLQARSNMSREEVLKRIDKQMSDKQRQECSQLVIENDGKKTLDEMVLCIQNFCSKFAG